MSDKKVRTYRINVEGIDEIRQNIEEIEDGFDRIHSKAAARNVGNRIASMMQGTTRMTKENTIALNDNSKAIEANERARRRIAAQQTLGQMSNLRSNDPVTLWRSAENIAPTRIIYPSELPYATRMLTQAGRMVPIRQEDIGNRALAAAIGIPFTRFLPALLKGVESIAQLDRKLERALSTVTSTSAGRAYGLNLARNYVTGFGMPHYGQLRLRNPSGLSNYEMAFLLDMNRSPYPLSASDLAYGHAGRGPIQSALPAGGPSQDPVQLWQRASRVLQGMRAKHLTMRMVAQRELHPISALMLPSQQIEAALAQSAYRPNVLSPYGRQVAGYTGINQIAGWGAMPSAIPHMTAEGVGLNLADVPISWVPRKRSGIRIGGPVDKDYRYVTWKSSSGVSLLPWNDQLSGVASNFMRGDPVFAGPFQNNLMGILSGAQRSGRRTLSYHDLSNANVGFTQWLNAISNPDYLYSNPFTTEESLVRSYMPNRAMFANNARGNLAYGQYMQDFFTNPRLFKSLGTPGQAGEYAGVLGRYIPQAYGAGASHEQVNALTNSLVELMSFAFPGITHNSLGRAEEDAKAFERVIGGPDFVDALAKTIGEAYQRAILSADVRTELRYNPEDRMPMYAGGMNIIPHMLRAFDMMLAGTSGNYSPMGLAARSMKMQGMSSRAMNQLLGISPEDEGEIVRTHKVPIPKPNIPLSKESPFQYMDYSKGAITKSRWELARHIKETTGSSASVGEIMLSISRTGIGSNLAGMLSREAETRNEEMRELSLFPSDIESIYGARTSEEAAHAGITGGSGAPLDYGMTSPVLPTQISGGAATGGRRRPKMPKRAGVLSKAFGFLNQDVLKTLLPLGLAAGIGLGAEMLFPGMGGFAGAPFAMMGVTMKTGGKDWNDWLAEYMASNPVPNDPEAKKAYYEQARALHAAQEGGVQAPPSQTLVAAAQKLAGGASLGGGGAANAKAKTIRMTDLYKDLQSMMTQTTPGATGARFSVEMQYPMTEEGSSERKRLDGKMTETLDKINKIGLEAKIGSKGTVSSYGGRSYANKFAVAGGKIDFSKPQEAEQMMASLAQVISESGAENVFFNKAETTKQATDMQSAISTIMGTSPGTRGEGLGKANVMSVKGRFAFTPDQADTMKQVREQLQGMGKDIQITTYRTSELDEANQRVYKDYLEIDQNIPLDKTNQYGETINKTVENMSQQHEGFEGSIKVMKTYDESMADSTTWTDKFISKGKEINKFSWQLTMLSLGALGVYFSMMGIVNLIKQGAAAIIGPLGDIEGMIKSDVFASIFGYGASGDIGEKINAALKWQGIMGTFTSKLTALGTTVLGDPDVQASIGEMFDSMDKFFNNPQNMQTIRDIFSGIASSVKLIADNSGPVLALAKAFVTPVKLPIVGEQSALSLGVPIAGAAAFGMVAGSLASGVASVVGKGLWGAGKVGQYGKRGVNWIKGLGGTGGQSATSQTIAKAAQQITQTGTLGQQPSMWSKLVGKGNAGLMFTSQDIQLMYARTPEEREAIAAQWNLMENPLEWIKQQVGQRDIGNVARMLNQGQTPEWLQAAPKDMSKDWFLGMDLASILGGGQSQTSAEQASQIAKQVAAEVPVNQNITVTFVIQGDMTEKTGNIAVTDLANLLRAYAKGNTPGGTS